MVVERDGRLSKRVGSDGDRELLALETKLKAQLKLKNPDEKVVKPLRAELQHRYARLVLRDTAAASKLGVEASLWKLCFYKKIDEFRRALAKGHEQLKDPAKSAAAEQALAATQHEFGKFLDKSSALYLALLQKAAETCSLVLPGYGRAPNAEWPAYLDFPSVDAANLSDSQHQALVGTCSEASSISATWSAIGARACMI